MISLQKHFNLHIVLMIATIVAILLMGTGKIPVPEPLVIALILMVGGDFIWLFARFGRQNG